MEQGVLSIHEVIALQVNVLLKEGVNYMNNIKEGVKSNKNLIDEDEQRQKASSKRITKKQLKELVKGATCTETQKEELVALLLRNRE